MGMSTLSPSSFNDSLSWDFNCYETQNGTEEDNNEVLTALVRSSYLNHLKKSLSNNYDHWLESNRNNDDFKCCQEDIMKCASYLEHKALRACMITNYYQRAMVKTMKEIKHSTEEGSLFSPLIEQLFDNKIKKMCNKETQTNVSLITCQVNDESHEKQPSTVDITLENSNLIIINPCNDLMKEKENNDGLEDLFNILMSSPTYPEKDLKDKFQSPKKRKYNDEPVLYNHRIYDNDSINFNHKMNNEESFSADCHYNGDLTSYDDKFDEVETSFDHSLTKNNHCPFIITENCDEGKFPMDSKPESVLEEVAPKSNLDERLSTLAALFGDDSPQPEHPNEREENSECVAMDTSAQNDVIGSAPQESLFKFPVDWKTEFAAQNCHLKYILSNMTTAKRYILQKRFRELFGERTFHTSISLNEEALCRKRTANIVVGELTPHYIAGRIASREIFKSLAKKITDDILLSSYVAGYDEIAKQVNYYFQNGRCINSEKDIENT